MPAHRHWTFLAVLGLALAVMLSGCGGNDEKKKSGDKPSSSKSGSSDSEPAPDPGYGAPKAGECHQMTAAQSVASVDTSKKVRCNAAHTSVVVKVGYLPKPVTAATPVAQRRALGRKLCRPAYQRAVGGTLADRATSILTWTLFTPSQAQLERGARWVRCDVLARSGNKLVPLPTPSPMLAAGVPEQVRICQTDAGIDVSCSRPHRFRVEAVYRAAGPAYPNPAAYTKVARARCQQLVKAYGGYWQPPSQEGWNAGDRFIRCLSATPSPSASPTP
jgi:Septum formation